MTPEQIEIEGMALVAPQPAELCYICGDAAFYYDEDGPLCPWHYGTRKERQTSNTPLLACQVCGEPATHEVPFSTEPHYLYYCDPCLIATDKPYITTRIDNRPLLAQCAALLTLCADLTTSMLGGPVATHGLIDEIRRVHAEIERVRAELAKAGW